MSQPAENLIPVTGVQLHPVSESGPTKAIGSVTLAGSFVIHGVRVVESEKGPFVAMPQRKDGDRYRDVAHPITPEMRGLMASMVLEEYQRMRSGSWESGGRGADSKRNGAFPRAGSSKGE